VNSLSIFSVGLPEKEDGLMRARFLPYIKFALVQMPYLGKDFTTLQAAENTMEYYCNNYFNHPQYFKVNGKPFVMLWRACQLGNTFQFFT